MAAMTYMGRSLVETGPENEDLTGVVEILAAFDAELAAKEAAEATAAPVMDVAVLGNWVVTGMQGRGKSVALLHTLFAPATGEVA